MFVLQFPLRSYAQPKHPKTKIAKKTNQTNKTKTPKNNNLFERNSDRSRDRRHRYSDDRSPSQDRTDFRDNDGGPPNDRERYTDLIYAVEWGTVDDTNPHHFRSYRYEGRRDRRDKERHHHRSRGYSSDSDSDGYYKLVSMDKQRQLTVHLISPISFVAKT